MNIELNRDEIGALLAALNYTKARTVGKSWLPLDDEVKQKLEEAQASMPLFPFLEWKDSEDRM